MSKISATKKLVPEPDIIPLQLSISRVKVAKKLLVGNEVVLVKPIESVNHESQIKDTSDTASTDILSPDKPSADKPSADKPSAYKHSEKITDCVPQQKNVDEQKLIENLLNPLNLKFKQAEHERSKIIACLNILDSQQEFILKKFDLLSDQFKKFNKPSFNNAETQTDTCEITIKPRPIQDEAETETQPIQDEAETETQPIQDEAETETQPIQDEAETETIQPQHIQDELEIETSQPKNQHEIETIQSEIETIQPNVSFKRMDIASYISSIKPETETIQLQPIQDETETETIQPETETIQPQPIRPETETIQPQPIQDETETETIQPETEIIQSETESIQSENKTIQTETETMQHETETIEHKTETETIYDLQPIQPQCIDGEEQKQSVQLVIKTQTETIQLQSETTEQESQTESEIQKIQHQSETMELTPCKEVKVSYKIELDTKSENIEIEQAVNEHIDKVKDEKEIITNAHNFNKFFDATFIMDFTGKGQEYAEQLCKLNIQKCIVISPELPDDCKTKDRIVYYLHTIIDIAKEYNYNKINIISDHLLMHTAFFSIFDLIINKLNTEEWEIIHYCSNKDLNIKQTADLDNFNWNTYITLNPDLSKLSKSTKTQATQDWISRGIHLGRFSRPDIVSSDSNNILAFAVKSSCFDVILQQMKDMLASPTEIPLLNLKEDKKFVILPNLFIIPNTNATLAKSLKWLPTLYANILANQ
jgi:hypothetical protein